MRQQISLRQANQAFARYIAAVERGQQFIVTRRGRPVALLSPAPRRVAGRLSAKRRRALESLFASARPLRIGRWRREALYEDA
jgi:prevent-host-death family protein